jgi:hypothetical protein
MLYDKTAHVMVTVCRYLVALHSRAASVPYQQPQPAAAALLLRLLSIARPIPVRTHNAATARDITTSCVVSVECLTAQKLL